MNLSLLNWIGTTIKYKKMKKIQYKLEDSYEQHVATRISSVISLNVYSIQLNRDTCHIEYKDEFSS